MTHLQNVDADTWVDERLALLAVPAALPDPDRFLPAMHARRAALRTHRLRLGGLAIAATIIFLAVPVTRAFGARCVEACVTVTSRVAQFWRADEPLANAPKIVGSGVGDLAPDLAGTDAAGQPISLLSLRGRVIVVNFWATWCAPCIGEIPVLNSLAGRYGPRGLEVIGVSLDQDGWSAIKAFAGRRSMTYPVALGSDDVAASFGGVDQLPATFVINANGVIVAKMVGAMRDGQYDALIEKMLR